MKHKIRTHKSISWLFILACCVFSLRVMSIERMNESELGGVSAVAGEYILDLFGPSAAGLASETQGNSSNGELKPDRSSDVKNVKETLKESGELTARLEDDENNSITPSTTLDESHINKVMAENKLATHSAESSLSRSEIKFKEGNISHTMKMLSDGGVSVTRDLAIDLLIIDNLRFDEHTASAGAIYLSDWHSQGTTNMVTHD